jgi:hypothetical protein
VARSPADTLLAVLAALPRDADLAVVRREPPGAAGAARRPGEWVVGVAPDARVEASGGDALAWLDRLSGGWWAGWLAYDLGRAVERVERRRPDDLGLPDLSLARFDTRLVVGPVGLRLEGDGPTRPMLSAAVRRARVAPPTAPPRSAWRRSPPASTGPDSRPASGRSWTSSGPASATRSTSPAG